MKQKPINSQVNSVIFVTVGYPPENTGGAEMQAMQLAREMNIRNLRVQVVTQNVDGKWVHNRDDFGVEVFRLPSPKIRIIGNLFYLLVLFLFLLKKRKEYDIIHVHLGNLQADIAALSCKITRRPLYVKMACGGRFGEIERLRKISKLTRWYGLKHANGIQAISLEIENELIDIGVQRNRIFRVPNGISLERYSETDTNLSQNKIVSQGEDRTVFLYLGRIATYKGLDILLEAWHRTRASQNSILRIVGPRAIDHPIEINSSSKSVEIFGKTANPEKYFRESDVFISPSLSEGMSNSIMEAKASGLPIIATKVGAAPELLSDGKYGILIEPNDIDGLSMAIDWMYFHPQDRKVMGRLSSEHIKQYEISKVVDQIINIYQDLNHNVI